MGSMIIYRQNQMDPTFSNVLAIVSKDCSLSPADRAHLKRWLEYPDDRIWETLAAAARERRLLPPDGKISPPLPPDFVFLPNAHDRFAVAKLRSAPIGGLAIDSLLTNNPQLIPEFREALAQVYLRAAQTRELRKATKHQIDHAKSVDKHLTQALKHLEAVSSDGRDGLTRLLVGPSIDDEKGEMENNRFGATIEGIRLDIARSRLALQSVIEAEVIKPGKSGERSKRLRTLIEALASWWLSDGGRSIAPNVRANRRDDGPAVVHGRSGKFLGFALALFCGADVFKNSEVEAAVTNV
jgi:hypothetical protein